MIDDDKVKRTLSGAVVGETALAAGSALCGIFCAAAAPIALPIATVAAITIIPTLAMRLTCNEGHYFW